MPKKQRDWNEIAKRLQSLEDRLKICHDLLKEETEKLLPKLLKQGVRFRVINAETESLQYLNPEEQLQEFRRLKEFIKDSLNQLDKQENGRLKERISKWLRKSLKKLEKLETKLQDHYDSLEEAVKEFLFQLHEMEGVVRVDTESLSQLKENFQNLCSSLEEATRELLFRLHIWSARFKVIEIEGVLGEYNFYE